VSKTGYQCTCRVLVLNNPPSALGEHHDQGSGAGVAGDCEFAMDLPAAQLPPLPSPPARERFSNRRGQCGGEGAQPPGSVLHHPGSTWDRKDEACPPRESNIFARGWIKLPNYQIIFGDEHPLTGYIMGGFHGF